MPPSDDSAGAPNLCPRCGAYWDCGCPIDEVVAVATALPGPSCRHDWVEAVGVEKDEELPDGREVLLRRLCGLYHASLAGSPSSSDEAARREP